MNICVISINCWVRFGLVSKNGIISSGTTDYNCSLTKLVMCNCRYDFIICETPEGSVNMILPWKMLS